MMVFLARLVERWRYHRALARAHRLLHRNARKEILFQRKTKRGRK